MAHVNNGSGWWCNIQPGTTMAATSNTAARERRRAASAEAAARKRAERDASTNWRACLRCGERFPSEGVHNRLCIRCRESVRNAGVPDGYMLI